MRTALLFLFAFGRLALAEPAELPLPKCYIPLAELASTCQGALVATLVSVASAELGPPGASDFSSHWKVIKTLRGNYTNEAELSFRVQTLPEEHRERKPTIGQTYILISYDSNATQVAYIFEHTEERLREIQQLLSAKNPSLKRFYSELQTLFRAHYPKATSHLLKDTIHFEQDTRIFIVHEGLMTGEWQDPREERGPMRGGILCDITLQKGRYEGQAKVSQAQAFDKRYFKVLLLVGYSAKEDVHVHVLLSYPANVSSDFLREFTELVNNFSKYVEASSSP